MNVKQIVRNDQGLSVRRDFLRPVLQRCAELVTAAIQNCSVTEEAPPGVGGGCSRHRTFVFQIPCNKKLKEWPHESSSGRWAALQRPAGSGARTPWFPSCHSAAGMVAGRVTSLSRRFFFPTRRRVSRGRRLRGGVPALYEPCGTGSGQCAVVKVGAAAEATQLYLGAVEDVVFLIFT